MGKEVLFQNKTDCCGCEACADICPQRIITMSEDEEGFYYPVIINPAACIGCKLCEKVCPIRNVDEINSHFTTSYAGWCKKEQEVISSSSGGFAFAIAKKALVEQYIIYGVSFSDDCYTAEYIRIDKDANLSRLKTSKYITSHKKNVFSKVLADLKFGHKVMFFGLPCDTFALLRFVGSSNNLITISLICHGPTSELFHKAYLKQIEHKHRSKVKHLNLRYKKNGNWKPYYIHAELADGSISERKFNDSEYDIVFQYFKRPSCHRCKFKNSHFAADILIGDYHSTQKGQESYHRSGVSSILPLTTQGEYILNSVRDIFKYVPVDMKSSIGQRAIHSAVDCNIDREEFITVFNKYGLVVACSQKRIKREQRNRVKQRIMLKIKTTIYTILHMLKLK